MPSGVRKLLALSILVGGLGLAWLLRPTSQGFGFAPGSERLILRNAAPLSGPSASTISGFPMLPVPLADQQGQSKPSGAASIAASGGSTGRNTSKPVLPSLPSRLPFTQTGKYFGPHTGQLNPPSVRRHRIVDGDSLEKLAQQYLGSAALAGHIYQANRSLLPDPQLLPVGAEIVIPAPDTLQPIPFEQLRRAELAPLADLTAGRLDVEPSSGPGRP